VRALSKVVTTTESGSMRAPHATRQAYQQGGRRTAGASVGRHRAAPWRGVIARRTAEAQRVRRLRAPSGYNAAVLFGRKARRVEVPAGAGGRPAPSTRLELLQWLADRPGCRRYLEIGCNRDKVFRALDIESKVGVDPRRGGTHRMTSDAFFSQSTELFDLVFVDGLHEARQVLRDLGNALAALAPGGVIVLHDCNPRTEEAQRVPPAGRGEWNGDVWKAVVHLRSRPDLDVAVGRFDHGCGVVLARPNSDQLAITDDLDALSWGELEQHRERWLRLMDGAALAEFVEHPPARD
jgi:predicted O-methyltransferase YrrM